MMNYQFIRDLQGSPVAEFEMGSETFSQWFTQELGTDKSKMDALFNAIQQLESRQIKEFLLQGDDVNLLLDSYEVEARSKILDVDAPDELPEGTELYDQESIAGCGLEDFTGVLESWRDFVSSD
nr:YacL family protein [uncultured Glaciecola sp.]